MIQLSRVSKTYHMGDETIHALSEVDLEVPDGEFIAIVGPSGSGKSTLMHIIGGLDSPTSGRVAVDGQDLSRAKDKALSQYRNKKVGFIFQTFNLQPTYSALENVALPLVLAGVSPKQRREQAQGALEAVGLADRIKHRPNELSGGQRQRVAIARALVNDPSILLADEPTGNLDTRSGQDIVDLLARTNQERGVTLILVTHDTEVAESARRTLYLRDGRIVEERRR
ncbi:MAG TPA: ABC transporter ATP-binding protein [Dehalococcoidia bacterium]|nr:ABC transporter ATP-binding protein [Dehalococcoidia bacterium]